MPDTPDPDNVHLLPHIFAARGTSERPPHDRPTPFGSVFDLLERQAAARPHGVWLRARDGERWTDFSLSALRDAALRWTPDGDHTPDGVASVVAALRAWREGRPLGPDAPQAAFPRPPAVSPDTPALLMPTPKRGTAVLDHGNLLAQAFAVAEWHRLTPDDRVLCTLPAASLPGLSFVLAGLLAGATVVLLEDPDPAAFWEALEREACSVCCVPAPSVNALCDHLHQPAPVRPEVRCVVCGNDLAASACRRFEDRFGWRLVPGLYLPETTGFCCFQPVDLSPEEYRRWLLYGAQPSVGCPVNGCEMDVHDPDGNPLSPDTAGEIVVRGHIVTRGYRDRPDVNNSAFAHGWFRTGRRGYYQTGSDGQTYFYLGQPMSPHPDR